MHLAGDQFGLENWWYSANSYGCDKHYYQNLTTGSVNGTVVVTQAGNCPNIQKVFLAHEFGASGIVIVNNRINMHSVMKMNLGELVHRGIEIFVASISLNTFRDQIYNELINAQNSSQKIYLRTVSKNLRVVQTQAIFFMKSVSDKFGSDIERLRNSISRSTQIRLRVGPTRWGHFHSESFYVGSDLLVSKNEMT